MDAWTRTLAPLFMENRMAITKRLTRVPAPRRNRAITKRPTRQPAPRRNRRDTTERNLVAAKKREARLQARIEELTVVVGALVKMLHPSKRALMRRAVVALRDRRRREAAKR